MGLMPDEPPWLHAFRASECYRIDNLTPEELAALVDGTDDGSYGIVADASELPPGLWVDWYGNLVADTRDSADDVVWDEPLTSSDGT